MNFLNRKTVEDIDVTGKRVLVRCDYNVPFDSEGNITDTKRIDESIKTLRYLIDHNAKVIICSHRGRPKGTVKPELSLAPTIPYLSKVLGQQVQMATDVVGESAKALCSNLQEGQVMMLENVRFEKGEEANDPAFAKELASLADIYVNDAFGTSHRAHASTAGVAAYLPAVCGYLIQKELQVLGNALNHPARPFVAILGDVVYGVNVDSLEQTVVNRLLSRGETVATAESCTGGLVSKRLTDIAGVSEVFEMGACTYSNRIKHLLIDVPNDMLAEYGAVSEQVAKAMAEGVCKTAGSTYGIGVTGIAGPGGGTEEKPVGLVYIGLTDGTKTWGKKLGGTKTVERSRDCYRTLSASTALNMLRRYLQGLNPVE